MAKSKTRPFAGIPNRVIEHPDFHALSANSVRLLLWFAYQYKGDNNGKLCAVHSQLHDKGFKSKSTLSAALKELLNKGFIELSKGSGLCKNGRTPNYYALTYESVDDIRGFDMDIKPTNKALRTFIDDVDKRRSA
ncbi:MAG: hypothetical protein ABNH03_02715 [Alteromonas sp.]|jgi:predicted nucleic acid-binding Zn ribbon protein|uniref:hypothetical protein n=1 Tax=Alteromonas sp. TaxID=232 RepID=UPI0032D8DC90